MASTLTQANERVKARDTTQAVRVETVAGTGEKGTGLEEGLATTTACTDPFAIAFDTDGAMYVAEAMTHVVVRVANGRLDRFAGTATAGGRDGRRLVASFDEPYDLEFAPDGQLFIIERLGHRVRRLSTDGRTETLAGLGRVGTGTTETTKTPGFNQPHDLCLLSDENVLICDTKNHRICRLDTDGNMSNVSLTPSASEGSANAKKLFRGPRVVVARGDRVYVAFREGNTVWRFRYDDGQLADGVRLAGTGKKGYVGDGGPATKASLGGPKGMDVDPNGHVFIADTENHVVRRIDADTGVITTIVGDGERGDGPDGEAMSCRLDRPHGITFGPDGHLYIADSLNHRVRQAVFE